MKDRSGPSDRHPGAAANSAASRLRAKDAFPPRLKPGIPCKIRDGTAKALRFAKVAMRGGDAGSRAVTVFDDSPLEVAAAAATDVMARVAGDVLGSIVALQPVERDTLLDTLDVWFDCGGSAEEAAKRLYCHPNTVRLRLRRITEYTGRALTDPRGITELALALRTLRQKPESPAELPATSDKV